MSDRFRELSDLLAALCDQRLGESERARLESLVLSDREALKYYLQYVQLHGLLHWDAAGGAIAAANLPEPAASGAQSAPRKRSLTLAAGAIAAAAAICLLLAWSFSQFAGPDVVPAGGPVAGGAPVIPQPDVGAGSSPAVARTVPDRGVRLSNASPPRVAASTGSSPETLTEQGVDGPLLTDLPGRSSESIVAVIDRRLRDYWSENGVDPAPRADDAVWVRRVHLDLVGRIPEADAVIAFLEDEREDKRARLVDELLSSPDFARHYSVVWTNLLIGHTAPREVNRPALEKFLREQFHRNRPWSETVTRLIAAEGYEDQDGATNFLLAHLNNEAVPATAVTARVLLCEQIQCTQCHNHPFVDWTQDRFWQLNAFFQQTEIVRHPRSTESGRRMRDRLELVSLQTGGPTYFEDRMSRMNVAYPMYGDTMVDDSPDTDRRRELARLLCSGDQPQVARAFVNRLWGKLFGYGFTNPIDDMGPHNQPVLPELLASLTGEFVRSGYDVKQLVRWICLSEAYQLAATSDAGNGMDRPASGSPPLFSRMYVRPLSAEQLFDSLLTATQADRAGVRYWEEVEARRRAWLEQFYTALENDENSEDDAFEGSLAQTLVMMNGDLIQQAVGGAPGTVLQQILSRPGDDEEQIRLLSLATLSRYPKAEELSALRRAVRQQVQARPREVSAEAALHEALRDLMWAYLNSTEFRSSF